MTRQSGKLWRVTLQPPGHPGPQAYLGRRRFRAAAFDNWAAAFRPRPLGSSLGAGRNRGDRLQDLRSDLVGVALRVRTAVFQIALIAVVGEGVRHTDRC